MHWMTAVPLLLLLLLQVRFSEEEINDRQRSIQFLAEGEL
jgi:hypothetical protein